MKTAIPPFDADLPQIALIPVNLSKVLSSEKREQLMVIVSRDRSTPSDFIVSAIEEKLARDAA